jgi:hypothetical protein
VGVLGWVDVDCDACETLGGVYVLDYDAGNSTAFECVWSYDSGVICTRTPACGTEQEARFTISATLNTDCRWTVTVAFEMLGGDDSCPKPRKITQYRLTNSDEADCDAMEIPELGVISSSNAVCSGTYLATITLSR